MPIGNERLRYLLSMHHISIVPFDPERLNPCSYDVALGDLILMPDETPSAIDITEQEMEFQAISLTELKNKGEVFFLNPHSRVLATTEEFIGSCSTKVATLLKAKSTASRLGLEVCGDGGFGDPCFEDVWCMSLYNKGRRPIVLKRGMVIAQIVFLEVDMCSLPYKSKYNDKSLPIAERIKPKLIKVSK